MTILQAARKTHRHRGDGSRRWRTIATRVESHLWAQRARLTSRAQRRSRRIWTTVRRTRQVRKTRQLSAYCEVHGMRAKERDLLQER